MIQRRASTWVRRRRGCRYGLTAVVIAWLLLPAGPFPARAIDLTGVLAYGANISGDTGPFWHTLTGARAGRPLAIMRSAPPGVRIAPLDNARNGTIDVELGPGPYIFTALWQYVPGEFPVVMMVLNLFFDGDMESPGISAVIPSTPSFTLRQANPMATTRSLALAEIANNGSLFYDDGSLRVELGAAFFVPGISLTNRWQPTDFLNVDRVGLYGWTPDGQTDGVLVFELLVTNSPRPAAASGQPAAPRLHAPLPPPEVQLGPDLWRSPTPRPELAPQAPAQSPAIEPTVPRTVKSPSPLESTTTTPHATTPTARQQTRTPATTPTPGTRTPIRSPEE